MADGKPRSHASAIFAAFGMFAVRSMPRLRGSARSFGRVFLGWVVFADHDAPRYEDRCGLVRPNIPSVDLMAAYLIYMHLTARQNLYFRNARLTVW